MKFTQMLEGIKEDVNKEESITLSLFSTLLHIYFALIIFGGLPFLFYILHEADWFR
nr:hypothetical protein [uncultured Bacillus sp.]